MKTFMIEKDTNNITAHPTAQEAESIAGAERFATAAALAELTADWPPARLVEIWNGLPGAKPVTKFKDCKTAVARIWKAIQNLGEPAATDAAGKSSFGRVRTNPARKTARSQPKSNAVPQSKSARQGSKTGKILDLLKRPGGARLQEIMKATGWQAHSVRGFISGTLSRKMSLTVVSTRTGDGDRSYSIEA